MKISDLILMSIRSLWRRKLRTFLTILGVVIGASSIILMLSLGIAMDSNFRAQIESMSSLTVVEVWAGWGDSDAPKLDDEALEVFAQIPSVERVIPQEEIYAYIEKDNYRTNWDVSIVAMDPDELRAMGIEADRGTPFPEEGENYIMIGEMYKDEFDKIGRKRKGYGNNEAIEINPGDTLSINVAQMDWETGKEILTSHEGDSIKAPRLVDVTVAGVYSFETQHPYSIYVSRELYKELLEAKEAYEEKLWGKDSNANHSDDENKYHNIKVKVSDEDQVLAVTSAITDLGYQAHSPMEYLEEMQKVSGSIQIILGGIGAVSLFVAAIGITNTMMMSIYERTKEIGIMKVIGAKLTDIQKMFLMEALMIGAIGGSIGVIFSYLISILMNHFGTQLALSFMGTSEGAISEIPLWLSVSALVFSTLIGLLAGYFPSRRAMKLSALSAIRTE